jgi:hypothetical protein
LPSRWSWNSWRGKSWKGKKRNQRNEAYFRFFLQAFYFPQALSLVILSSWVAK